MAADAALILEELLASRRISIERGSIFDRVPPPVPLERLRTDERIEGMILGIAVGDSLGLLTERNDPEVRHDEFGTIVDHFSTPWSSGGRVSDDTQLSLWTLERLLALGRLDVDDLAARFVGRREHVVGMGRNTAGSLQRHRDRLRTGSPPFHACAGDPVVDGRGNGALMRYTPLVLPHLRSPSPRLWADAAIGSLITHGHPSALSSVVAFAHLVWEILRRPTGDAPPPEWWLDEYVRVARDLETATLPDPVTLDPVPRWYQGFRGTLWQFVDTRVRDAWRRGVSVWDACSLDGFGSRADSVQTVPAALYILMHHADSFESAVIAAVNDTKDNDTTASIVGALLGALHGRRVIRKRWIAGIRSRSLSPEGGLFGDDRRMIEQLASEAAERFGAPIRSS